MGEQNEKRTVREDVAQAVWVGMEGPNRADEWWDAGEHEAHRVQCYRIADAVLDALGLEQVGWRCTQHSTGGVLVELDRARVFNDCVLEPVYLLGACGRQGTA
jgi:hypothetical protein